MVSRLYIEALLNEFEGVGIDGQTKQTFSLPATSMINWIVSTGNSALRQDAWCLPDVCAAPSGIWRGLGRTRQEKTLIYSGIPTGNFAQDYNMNAGEDFSIPPDRVFLVFLSEEYQIAKFRFEEADSDLPTFPVNYRTRFTEQLWPLHS